RCWMSTKAQPVFAGRLRSSRANASSPPADAPIPTTGKSFGSPDARSSIVSLVDDNGILSAAPWPHSTGANPQRDFIATKRPIAQQLRVIVLGHRAGVHHR